MSACCIGAELVGECQEEEVNTQQWNEQNILTNVVVSPVGFQRE